MNYQAAMSEADDVMPTPQPIPMPVLTKELFARLTVAKIIKRDGTTGFVMSSQARGKSCSFSKGDFSLDYNMKKKEKFNPNQVVTASPFIWETWLFGGLNPQASLVRFEEMLQIFGNHTDGEGNIILYMNTTDESQLLSVDEYENLA